MRHYELMLILDSDLEERTLADTVNNLIKVVPAENGTVDNVDIWGRRRFAYEIQKKSEGYYVVVDFHAEPATLAGGFAGAHAGHALLDDAPRLTRV